MSMTWMPNVSNQSSLSKLVWHPSTTTRGGHESPLNWLRMCQHLPLEPDDPGSQSNGICMAWAVSLFPWGTLPRKCPSKWLRVLTISFLHCVPLICTITLTFLSGGHSDILEHLVIEWHSSGWKEPFCSSHSWCRVCGGEPLLSLPLHANAR